MRYYLLIFSCYEFSCLFNSNYVIKKCSSGGSGFSSPKAVLVSLAYNKTSDVSVPVELKLIIFLRNWNLN